MSRRSESESGDVIAGRYRLVRLLGEGGMGRVYLAEQTELGGQVAIKLLRSDVELPESAIERFRREAKAASRLKSESVVRVVDLGRTEDGTPYFVMERVAGKTVQAHLAEHGPFELSRAVDIVIDVCGVLAEAHALGIIHRDIKASNIALTKRPDGTELVKVLDFGIAKQTAPEVTSLTETSALLGSPKYMSPDHIRDARSVGPPDDLWSLVVLLQEMTTGVLPFEAFTLPGLFAKIVADPPTPARTTRPELPEAFEALLLRGLAKSSKDRFTDAAELAEALVPFASPEGAPRARRVRAVLAHAAIPLVSERPPTMAVAATLDLDQTNAPIAREQATEDAPRRPSPGRSLRTAAFAGIAVVVLSLGALLRARSSHGSEASAPAGTATVAVPANAMPTATASASRTTGEPMPSVTESVPATHAPAQSATVASPSSAMTAARPRPSALPSRMAPSATARKTSSLDEDDFGPRY